MNRQEIAKTARARANDAERIAKECERAAQDPGVELCHTDPTHGAARYHGCCNKGCFEAAHGGYA